MPRISISCPSRIAKRYNSMLTNFQSKFQPERPRLHARSLECGARNGVSIYRFRIQLMAKSSIATITRQSPLQFEILESNMATCDQFPRCSLNPQTDSRSKGLPRRSASLRTADPLTGLGGHAVHGNPWAQDVRHILMRGLPVISAAFT